MLSPPLTVKRRANFAPSLGDQPVVVLTSKCVRKEKPHVDDEAALPKPPPQESAELKAFRTELGALDTTGRRAESELGLKARALGVGKDKLLQFTRGGLIDHLVMQKQKELDTPDWVAKEWRRFFESEQPAAEKWAEVKVRLNVRLRFNYVAAGELPNALKFLWSACFCWGELATVVAPKSFATWAQRCFEPTKLMGDEVRLMPIVGVLLSKLEYWVRDWGTEASDAEIKGLLSEGYSDQRTSKPRDYLILHAFETPGGVRVPGAIFTASPQDFHLAGNSKIAGPENSHGGVCTQLYTTAKNCNLVVERADCFSLRGTVRLWHYLNEVLSRSGSAAELFAAGDGSTEAIILETDQGKQHIQGMFAFGVKMHDSDSVRFLTTDYAWIIKENLNRMTEDDMAPGSGFGQHVRTVSLTEGFVRQRTKQVLLSKLAGDRSANAINIYAIIEMLNEIPGAEKIETVPYDKHSVLLHPDAQHYSAKKPEERVAHARATLEKDMHGTPQWSPVDMTKAKIVVNAFDPTGPSAWLFCTNVLRAPTAKGSGPAR